MASINTRAYTFIMPIAVAVIYMLPLNLNVANIGNKPIDLAASNIFLIFLPALFLPQMSVSAMTLFGLALPFTFIAIGFFSSITRGGDLSIILSVISFVLPIFHIGVGCIVGKSRMRFSFLHVSYALSVIILVLLISDLSNGNFPRGCGYQGRWGGCFAHLEVYGFPNASVNFLAVCSPLLLLPIIRKSNKVWRVLAVMALFSLAIIVPLSLSRSAFLTLLISFGMMLVILYGAFAFLIYAALCLAAILSFQWIVSLQLFAGLAFRIQAGFEVGDISNGRLGIWQVAISKWAENPIFGKAFVPFSEFSQFGTVHQQYVELLYKSGLTGFVLFFGYILIVAWRAQRVLATKNRYTVNDRRIFIAFGMCMFVANFFQPAISYQPLGNFMFFAAGVFLARSPAGANQTKVYNEANCPKPLHRSV